MSLFKKLLSIVILYSGGAVPGIFRAQPVSLAMHSNAASIQAASFLGAGFISEIILFAFSLKRALALSAPTHRLDPLLVDFAAGVACRGRGGPSDRECWPRRP